MSQFTNSYILSKAIFWSTYEAITDKEWLEADRNVHLFRFGKGKKKNNNNNKRRYPSMSAIKSSFPYDDGGFEMWIPSIRSHASTASLFFHLLNESPILRSIIVNIVNKLDLVPSISNNSTGDIIMRKPSSECSFIGELKHLKPVQSLNTTVDLLKTYSF
eukprot:TRINITY_DN2223_c0_g1_i15.p1 TRINITY_DN2223_c0_g1~~TRINITY_DN2223_c0_g1_i15.p1  ORF type:complete len:160 (+),score=11.13 TRINITY_DN2223_c0_g1_i15:494-973(+)